MDNPIYNRIKSDHPDWSEEQLLSAVSLSMQSEAVIEKAGADVDINSPDIIEQIIRGAEAWLEEVLPLVFEKVEQLFRNLLNHIGDWIRKGFDYVMRLIGEFRLPKYI